MIQSVLEITADLRVIKEFSLAGHEEGCPPPVLLQTSNKHHSSVVQNLTFLLTSLPPSKLGSNVSEAHSFVLYAGNQKTFNEDYSFIFK